MCVCVWLWECTSACYRSARVREHQAAFHLADNHLHPTPMVSRWDATYHRLESQDFGSPVDDASASTVHATTQKVAFGSPSGQPVLDSAPKQHLSNGTTHSPPPPKKKKKTQQPRPNGMAKNGGSSSAHAPMRTGEAAQDGLLSPPLTPNHEAQILLVEDNRCVLIFSETSPPPPLLCFSPQHPVLSSW